MKTIFKIVFLFGFSLYAKDATIEIVKKIETAPKIMVQDGTINGFDSTFKSRFYKMLIGDLKVTMHFNVIDAYVQNDYNKKPITNLGDKKPNFIIQYQLINGDGGHVFVKAKLVNIINNQTIIEKQYSVSSAQMYPFLSHNVISDINDKLGNSNISWMKKFVLLSKNVASKKNDIVLADYTLTYQKTLISGGMNLFPKWANSDQKAFFYTSFTDSKPTLYKFYLNNLSREKIISSAGMLVASDVSSDGKKMLLTMAPNGQPDIYMYDLNSRALTQVTTYKGIDVNGGFVDNDKKIVFISDRLGYPNIFSKAINSRAVEQMIYHGKNNVSASSYGNYIVYSSRDKDSEFGSSTFNLYLISTKTDFIRQLTATGKNLFPRFSDDGKSVLFIKNYGSQSALGIIRLDFHQVL